MNSIKPFISVITIVKDNEKLLPRAVDSVISQTFHDFKYTIVNDGSTDRTKAIIDKYAAENNCIQPIHMTHNVGRAMARNKGLEEASGKYIFFLDADDYLPATALADLCRTAEEHNADIVYGRIKAFDQIKGNWLPTHYTDQIITYERHNFCLDDHLDLVDNHQIVGRLFKREMLNRNDLRFSITRKNGEDVLFAFYTAFHARNISMVPHKTVYFYSLGNYLNNANENKLFDARDNVLETINYSLQYGSAQLKKRMRRKGLMFAGNLERAQKVYAGDEGKFKNYLKTLVPFIKGIQDDDIADFPLYFLKFAKNLNSYNFNQAYLLWVQKNKQLMQMNNTQREKRDRQEVERLKLINQKLAQQLDSLYNSTSWRITAPLRRLRRFLRAKGQPYPLKDNSKPFSTAARLQPGLDMSLELTGGGFGKHRSGWKAVAMDSLLPLHNPEGVYFVSFLEKTFLWGNSKPVLFPRPWIGVTHRPHNIPSWLPSDMRSLFYQSEHFAATLPGCLGIFTLSNYHAKHIREKLPVQVESLLLPTEIPEKQFDPASLSAAKVKVVQVGWWLRNLHGIFMLQPSSEYEKIYLTKREFEPVDRYFTTEAEYLKHKGLFRDSMYDTARTVDFLSNDEYDELLSSSVIFLDLYDASANNAVVEGIARATPILVNPIEPVVEYLGEEYPLYYNSYEEAVEKLDDRDLLLSAHEYLLHCPTREKLSGSFFKKSIEKSEIYKSIFDN